MLGEIYRTAFFNAESILIRSKQLFRLFKYANDLVFARSRFMRVFLIKGLVKNTNYLAEVTFIGTKESAYEFVDQAYSKIESMSLLDEISVGQVNPSYLRQAKIAVARVDRPFISKFTKDHYLVLPNVSFILDLRMSIASLIRRMSRRRRRDIRKIPSFKYSFSISRGDESDFDFFYREMYLPYTLKRFQKTAHIKAYLDSKAFYRGNGGILFLKKNDMPVAGILFQIRGREIYATSFGVYRGDKSLLRDLVSQATLFFLIKWAKSQGLRRLDYGVSSPFFNEGIFTYKREWGMTVEEQRNQSVYVMKFNSISQGLLTFLLKNPFITVYEGKLRGVVFADHKLAEDELKHIFSRYFLPKLDSLIVIAFYKSSREVRETRNLSVSSAKLMKSLQDFCEALQRSSFCVQISELKK